MKDIISLGDRIGVAKTASAITALLDEGKSYQFATDKTRQRWAKIAKARLASFDAPKEVEVPAVEKVKKPRAKKSKTE